MQPRFGVGEPDLDLVVEAARAPESGVERARAVGGGYDADSPRSFSPSMRERSWETRVASKLSLIMSREEAKESISSKSMIAGALAPRFVEDGAQLRLALAPELVEYLRPRDGYEVCPALVGDRPRQERLARPRRPVEEDALVRPDVELAEDLGVGYGQLDRLADQSLWSRASRRRPRSGWPARCGCPAPCRSAAATPAPPLRTLRARRSIRPSRSSCESASSRPSRVLTTSQLDRARLPCSARPCVPARVYPLGEAGDDLGGRVEVEDGAPDARAEVREDALGDGLLVHLKTAVIAHLAEGVPGVGREVVVVVDLDLTAREELLVRERYPACTSPSPPPRSAACARSTSRRRRALPPKGCSRRPRTRRRSSPRRSPEKSSRSRQSEGRSSSTKTRAEPFMPSTR